VTAGSVLSVNVAVPENAENVAQPRLTGINKQPVDHPVLVHAPGPQGAGPASGLIGDQIFDTDNHGGVDQAVYAYAREDYDWWEKELGRKLPGGLFGENLTLEGAEVNGAVLGEIWRIGAELTVQTTFARIPCMVFQGKMQEPRWIKTFTREARPGAYFRVLKSGEVKAGDRIEVLERPAHGVTIEDGFRAWTTEQERLPSLLAVEGLPKWVDETLHRRLRR
jgi:MOSC domain-containing protein YiiM